MDNDRAADDEKKPIAIRVSRKEKKGGDTKLKIKGTSIKIMYFDKPLPDNAPPGTIRKRKIVISGLDEHLQNLGAITSGAKLRAKLYVQRNLVTIATQTEWGSLHLVKTEQQEPTTSAAAADRAGTEPEQPKPVVEPPILVEPPKMSVWASQMRSMKPVHDFLDYYVQHCALKQRKNNRMVLLKHLNNPKELMISSSAAEEILNRKMAQSMSLMAARFAKLKPMEGRKFLAILGSSCNRHCRAFSVRPHSFTWLVHFLCNVFDMRHLAHLKEANMMLPNNCGAVVKRFR